MPVGIPKAGYRRSKKLKGRTLAEIEAELAYKVPDLVAELEKISKPLPCPHCGEMIPLADRDAIIYLIDRAMGKPKQRSEIDVTQSIVFSADQIEAIISRLCEENEGFRLAYESYLALPSPKD